MSDSTPDTQELPITIRPLRIPEDGEALAELFNAFNKIWEGGFFGQGRNTAGTAIDFISQAQWLEIYVAEDAKGHLMGICSVHPHYRDSDACYVGVLGAHPKAIGKKVGKRLMLKALEKANEAKMARLDLNTWPGNLKAMPLYKKIGLFWVPDTTVSMENYIPGILSNPTFREFWQKYPDWYSIFKREINQSPDAEELDGLDVYTYRFEAANDHLVVWIDRYAKDILGFDLKLNGRQLKARVKAPVNIAHRGLTHPFFLLLSSSEPIPSLMIEAKLPNEIQLQRDLPMSLDDVTETTIENQFTVALDAPLYRPQFKGLIPKIKLSWGQEQETALCLGLKIESAIEIDLSQESRALNPNHVAKPLELVLTNKLKSEVQGKLIFTKTGGFTLKATELPVSLASEEAELLAVEMEREESNEKLDFGCKIVFEANSGHQTTETEEYTFEIPVLAFSRFHVLENSRKETVTVHNGFAKYEFQLRGGAFQTHSDEDLSLSRMRQTQSLGPPYGFDEFNRLIYNWDAHNKGQARIISLWAESEQRPGLILKKSLFFEPNSLLVQTQVAIENRSSEKNYSMGLRVSHLSNSNPHSFSYTVPFEGHYIKTDRFNAPRTAQDFGTDPTRFHESWLALENQTAQDAVIGIFWDPPQIKQIRVSGVHLGTLDYAFDIKPGETKDVADLYFYYGPGSWLTIQNLWFQLLADKSPDNSVIPCREDFITVNQVSAERTNGKEYLVELEIASKLLLPTTGHINLATELGTFTPSTHKFECSINQPTIIRTTFLPTDEFTKPEIPLSLEIQTVNTILTEEIRLSLPIPTSQKVAMDSETRDDMQGVVWRHPLFEGFCAPTYSAGFVSLKFKGKNELIQSPFPQTPPSFFLLRERGGLRFTVGKEFNDILLGKDEIEYQAREITHNGYKGIEFIPNTLDKIKGLRNVRTEFAFLAHPDQNDLLLSIKVINEAKAPINLLGALEMAPTLAEDLIISFQSNKRPCILPSDPHQIIGVTDLSSPIIFESSIENWKMILEPPRTYPTISLFADVRPAKCMIETLIPMYLRPGEEKTVEFKFRIV
ncbi:MAG: GNAT family N-acetyltransferase [Candidatus Thorarchaeota archaeon]